MNTVHDIENEEVIECTTKSENCSSDREINNNISNTFYLQRDGEDKRDKSDKKSQQKTVKFSRVEEIVVIRRDSGDKLMKMLEIDEVPSAPTAADKSDTQKIDDTGNGPMSTSTNNEIPAKRRRDASDSEILKTEPKVNRNNSITPPRLSAVSSSGVSTNARPPPPPPPTRAAVVTAAAVESSSSSIGESPLFFCSYDLCYAKSDACAAHSSKRLRRTQTTKMESCKLLFYILSCCP